MDKETLVYVDLDGTPHLMGRLWARVRKNKESATFEYDEGWLKHPARFSLEPALQLGPGPFHTPADTPMFGAVGDSVPDRWGRALMRRMERRRAEREGTAPRTLQEIDFLLLVDDDKQWLQACKRGFRGLGRVVHTTTSAAGALAFAAKQPPELVVTEIRIDGESGLALIEALRRAHPSCTIAIVSAYLSVALTAEAMRKGAQLVLFKPVHPMEIVRQLAQAEAAGHPWVTPTLARAEWEHISRVLSDCKGNVSEAARRLGILRQSLQRRLRKHAPSH